MGWVRLHPYNIAQKVQIVVEHFRAARRPAARRARPRRWWWSAAAWRPCAGNWPSRSTSRSSGYTIGTLVAFSGEVNDKESGPDAVHARHSQALNPNLKGRDIREAFKGDEYQILLVANKFQTGFDQPLLCGMYVDKRLAGIQAVQTLSRLNRAHPGKDTTYVLDFVNDAGRSPAAFKTYYTTAELSATHRPEPRLQPARQAGRRRALRRLRGRSRGRGGARTRTPSRASWSRPSSRWWIG